MTSIKPITLGVSDPTAALAFYTAAFGVGTHVGGRAAEAPFTDTDGFAWEATLGRDGGPRRRN
jgi:catechol 2,3-dioxygenase-like lactoylglutathione lyase family enzyme